MTPGKVQEYRMHRATTPPKYEHKKPPHAPEGKDLPKHKPPARSTIHDEIVTLRQILKTAVRHGWLSHLSVGVSATVCEQTQHDDYELVNMDMAFARVATVDDALAIIRNALSPAH